MPLPKLSSNFELVTCHATSRLSKLYLVRHSQSEAPGLAFLKIPYNPENRAESDLAANTEFELRDRKISPNLQQPVAIHHFEEGTCLEYEYFEGVQLDKFVKFCHRNDIDLTPDLAVHLVSRVLDYANAFEKLSAADKNQRFYIAHANGMSNIYITASGKLAPVGPSDILRDKQQPNLFWSALASPEFCVEGHAIDNRADLYSIGCMLFNILTGKPIISTKEYSAHIAHRIFMDVHPAPSDVDPLLGDFDEIVKKSVACMPEKRFQTAAAFRSALLSVYPEIDHTVAEASLSAIYKAASEPEQDQLNTHPDLISPGATNVILNQN